MQLFYEGYDPAWILGRDKGPPVETKPKPPPPKEEKKPVNIFTTPNSLTSTFFSRLLLRMSPVVAEMVVVVVGFRMVELLGSFASSICFVPFVSRWRIV